MSQKRSFYCAVVLLMFVMGVVSGCSTKKPEEQAAVAGPGTEALDTSSTGTPVGEEEGPGGRTSKGMFPVYFDFDMSNIRADQVESIEKTADFIKQNSSVKVRVEGNCDERGTNEYNLALGERRAQSAKKYLVNLGVDAAQLSTVSLGEEKPLLHGHDETSWAQNRRDDFVIAE